MEAVIRLALGEQDVDTAGITAGRLGEADVDQLITDAEKDAVERGWNPPLASVLPD